MPRPTLNSNEEKAIEELQMRIKDYLTPTMRDDESLYYRFLKAREFDVDKAEIMLRNHITFRKVNQNDTLLEDFKPTEVFLKHIEPTIIGFDKDGDILRYSASGKYDPVEIMKCMTFSYYMKHWFWFAENMFSVMNKENEKTGRKAFQVVMIFDLEKLTFANATSKAAIDMFLRFIAEYQNNFPERMKAAYVINAPSFFVIVFSILKAIMSSHTINKIHVFGNNGWKEKLTESIDADILPAFLGGNLTDPDGNPLCKTFINHGGKIPDCYFLPDEERFYKDTTQVKNLVVPAAQKKEIHVEVNNLGSLIHWEFLVKGKNIGFGIFLETSDIQMVEVIPVQRYDTADGREKESHKCRSVGKYIIVFDNSYSRMSSKSIQYLITLEKPNL